MKRRDFIKLVAALSLVVFFVSCGGSGGSSGGSSSSKSASKPAPKVQKTVARETREVTHDYDGPVSVIFLEGQSLMVGGYHPEEDQPVSIPDHIDFYSVGNNIPDVWGPEVGIFATLPDDRHWVIIKYAVGGTLAEWWLPGSDKLVGDRTESLYAEWRTVTAEILDNYESYEIVAIVWDHGQSDSARDTAFQYLSNIKKLFWYQRAFLKNYYIPILVGTCDWWEAEYIEIVRQAQAEFVDGDFSDDTILVINDGLPKKDDGVHRNTEGTMLAGINYGDVLVSLVGE